MNILNNDPAIDFDNYSVAILAGGKGTRIQQIDNTVPKPLIKIANKPILFYQLDFLLQKNFNKIYILAGYKGSIIDDSIKEHYHNEKIETIIEHTSLDTAGCLFYIKNKLKTKYLILISGDLVFNISLLSLCQFHERKNSSCTLTVHSNSHPRDADLIVYNKDTFQVEKLLLRPHPKNLVYSNSVNAAISVLNINLLDIIKENTPSNFEKNFLVSLLENKENIYAYHSFEYIHDMGTPERYYQVEKDIINCIPEQKKIESKKKAFIFDMNQFLDFMESQSFEKVNKFSLMIKEINLSSFILIGYYSTCDLKDILKIETFLGDLVGAKFDLICPIGDYSINLLFYYLKNFTIMLNDSFFIGEDTSSDVGKKFSTIEDFLDFCLINEGIISDGKKN